jgi:hypothetical protein
MRAFSSTIQNAVVSSFGRSDSGPSAAPSVTVLFLFALLREIVSVTGTIST